MSIPTDAAAGGAPVWERVTAEIRCPLCDYNLRGLVEPRCPECGYAFEWAELTDESRKRHAWLFEHQPHRNVRSFFRTMFAGLRPIRFWRSISPVMPSHPDRLGVYWMAGALLAFASALAALWLSFLGFSLRHGLRMGGTRRVWVHWDWQDWQYAFKIALRDVSHPSVRPLIVMIVAYLMWPWLLRAALLIFQQSMRKAKIGRDHVMRCVVYSFDNGWMYAVGIVIGLLTWWLLETPRLLAIIVAWMPLWLLLYSTVRVYIAYRIYLRFDHAIWTILAAQIIVALAVFKILIELSDNRIFRWGSERWYY